MKKLIYFLFLLCIIMNQKMVTQASDNQTSNLDLCYANSISDDYDLNDYEDYLDYLDEDMDDITTDYSSKTENQNSSVVLIIVIFLVAYAIQGCIFGYAAQKIIENKGHQENWFWWGFFFGLIALLVALSKPQLHSSTLEEQNILRGIAEEATDYRIMKEGGWECAFCHRKNDKIVTTCTCGKNQDDTNEKIRLEEKKRTEQQQPATNHSEINTIELLEKYKQLLDSGVITQEEFDAKKKQLLDT